MAGINLDLSKTHLHRHIGDLIIVYTWVNDERAMVLLPARRANAPWFIVCDSVAWQYDDPVHLAAKAKTACEVLGMRPIPENWVKIATVIHEGLPDLVSMPSAPPLDQMHQSFGELELRADGETLNKTDIKIDKVGATYA